MEKKKPIWRKMFVAFLMMQIIAYFLNSDQFLQLSGMYIFLFGALMFGLVGTLVGVWNKNIQIYSFLILTIIVCMLISAAVNYSVVESGYLLSYVFLLFMTFLFATMDFDEADMKKIKFAYVILALIISALIIVFHKRFYAEESNRITIQIGSNPLIDPNYLAACLVAPSFFSIQFAMESKKNRVLKWVLAAIILVGIFMTGSRGAMLAWGVGILIIVCKKFLDNFSAKKLMILIVGAVVAVVIVFRFIPAAYIERIFDVNTWMDASNIRRIDLWKNAFEMVFKRPLFGYGLGNTVSTIGTAAHNSYLELCVHFGLIGGILFIVLLGILIFKKGNLYMKATVVSTVIWAVFISANVTMFLWLNISLCILSSRIENEKKKKRELCNEQNR